MIQEAAFTILSTVTIFKSAYRAATGIKNNYVTNSYILMVNNKMPHSVTYKRIAPCLVLLVGVFQSSYSSSAADAPEKTFRHEAFEEYKIHREPMPDPLALQMDPIQEFCHQR